jgi:hypothetical protein
MYFDHENLLCTVNYFFKTYFEPYYYYVFWSWEKFQTFYCWVYCVLWTVYAECFNSWNVPFCENTGFRNVHRGSRFLFFCFCKLLSVTRFLNAHRCYLHISDAFSQFASLLSSHQWRVFSTRVAAIFTSVTRLLNMRRCYVTSVTRFRNTRHWYLHISDAFLRVTNLSTSQTQHKWRVFSASLMTLWTRH